MKKFTLNKKNGFGILAVIITLCTLITLLSFVMYSRGEGSNVLISTTVSNTLVSQSHLIKARILSCGLEYPEGNNGTGFRVQYPGAATVIDISTMTCPGASNANIWTLLDGLTVPKQVDGFGTWKYINDGVSMRLTIVANTTDRANLLPNMVSMLGTQATITGGNTLNLVVIQ